MVTVCRNLFRFSPKSRSYNARAKNSREAILHPQADAKILLAQQRYTDANPAVGRRFYDEITGVPPDHRRSSPLYAVRPSGAPQGTSISALTRKGLCAMALLGLLAFWAGLWMAARRYPSEYDWRYMSISSLVYADRNPDGYQWARVGLLLCALGGLCWTAVLSRDGRREGTGHRPVGIWALSIGYVCMVFALVPERVLRVPKGHEILALAAFFGQCIGIVQLTFRATERHLLRLRTRPSPVAPRLYAGLLAGTALLPILLAALAPAYVSYALPELRWVGLEWRSRGVPLYLSFTFWEWITCAIFSMYTAGLCLVTKWI
jgi:hypothetical protein